MSSHSSEKKNPNDNDSYFFKQDEMDQEDAHSIRSLDRSAGSYYELAPREKSLVYVMSLDSDKKEDIYERINEIQDRFRGSATRKSNNNQFRQQQSDYASKEQKNRRSAKAAHQYHTCKCLYSCQEMLCECFSTINQLCLKGVCCDNCVQHKIWLLSRSQGCLCKNSKCLKMYCKCYQNNKPCGKKCRCQGCKNNQQFRQKKSTSKNLDLQKHPSFIEEEKKLKKNHKNAVKDQNNKKFSDVSCSCRKTQCSKKYCSCFYNGNKCGKFCICENCENKGQTYYQNQRFQIQDEEERDRKLRYASNFKEEMEMDIEQNIQQYFQESDGQGKQIPSSMEFEPVDLNGMLKGFKPI